MTEPQKYSVSQGSRWLIVHNDGAPVATVFTHEIGLERAREIALMIRAELNSAPLTEQQCASSPTVDS